MEELKKKIEVFLGFCEEKNLKLKPSKMTIGEEVEFTETTIRAETQENEDVVSILPQDKRIKAFFELKKPETKKEIQVMCGMLSSLQIWNPNLPLNLSMLRKATASKGKLIWNEVLEEEYNNAMEIRKTRINLSSYDPTKDSVSYLTGQKPSGLDSYYASI